MARTCTDDYSLHALVGAITGAVEFRSTVGAKARFL